jgi:WD40 repeat protein
MRAVQTPFSPDGLHIASCADDKLVRLCDVTSAATKNTVFQSKMHEITSVALSPDGMRAASSLKNGKILVWDAQCSLKLTGGHEALVTTMVFVRGGEHIISGSEDQTVRVWNTLSGRDVLCPLQGHTGTMRAVACSLKTGLIASGSDDRTVCVWDASSGKSVCDPLQGHDDSTVSVAFSPDGTQLVSGSLNKTLIVWGLTTTTAVFLFRDYYEGHFKTSCRYNLHDPIIIIRDNWIVDASSALPMALSQLPPAWFIKSVVASAAGETSITFATSTELFIMHLPQQIAKPFQFS